MEHTLSMEDMHEQALRVADIAQELFNAQLLGVYLYGSAALGGLHVDSDIDLLIIADHSMSDEMRAELTARLLAVSGKVGCGDRRPLEVTVINQADIVPWQSPPKCEYMYGEWLRPAIEAGQIPRARADPDLTILLWQARRHSRPLQGVEAASLIPPIPTRELQSAMLDSLPALMANLKGDDRNVLLTLARMWFTLATGEICPKDIAAEWVLPRLPPKLAPLLKVAQQAYLGECTDDWGGLSAETASLSAFLQSAIEGLRNAER